MLMASIKLFSERMFLSFFGAQLTIREAESLQSLLISNACDGLRDSLPTNTCASVVLHIRREQPEQALRQKCKRGKLCIGDGLQGAACFAWNAGRYRKFWQCGGLIGL